MSSSVSSVWNTIRSSISSIISGIQSSISSGFNNAYNTVSNIFGNIKSKISSIMDNAKTTVQNAINRIKNFFNFSWSLPKIKLPHFKITGSFSLNPPSIPTISVDWYKKAMEDGMILNSPTIFGAMNGKLLAGGEAGSEAVVGTKSLMDMIRNAVTSMTVSPTNINYGGVSINVYAKEGQNATEIAEDVADILNNQIRREGAVWA